MKLAHKTNSLVMSCLHLASYAIYELWVNRVYILWKSTNCGIGWDFHVAAPPTFIDKFQKFLWLMCCLFQLPLLFTVIWTTLEIWSWLNNLFLLPAKCKIRTKLSTPPLKKNSKQFFNQTFIEFLIYRYFFGVVFNSDPNVISQSWIIRNKVMVGIYEW